MESVTILTPPSKGLSGIEPNIPKGPDYEKINTISMYGEKFYQLHAA